MSRHIGTVGQRISAEVTLVNEFTYTDYKFSYYGTTHYTYIMHDAEGNVLVWKTTSCLMLWDEKTQTNDCIHKGDKMLITGTVKEHSEYKEVAQTVLSRCKYSLIEHKAVEQVKTKREQQEESLQKGDFVWSMPYSQYKEHYSDCETLAGSYDEDYKMITVIIREGRLKKSGVRGEHYRYFVFNNAKNEKVNYYAISEETARKRMKKDGLNSNDWELYTIHRL